MQMTAYPAFVDLYSPSSTRSRVVYGVILAAVGSALIGLSAQASIRLPFSSVPITGQTFVVLLIGALYGWRLGVATVILYLVEGLAGLPVFAEGRAGPGVLVGPSGGYLAGFIAGVVVVGLLARRGWDRRFGSTAAAMVLGTTALLAPGLLWQSLWDGPHRVFVLTLPAFLPGAAVKITLAAALLPSGWRVLEWLRR